MTERSNIKLSRTTTKNASNHLKSENEIEFLIEQYSQIARERLAIDQALWSELHSPYSQAPQKVQLGYYTYIDRYGFNPLFGEIILAHHPDHSWQVFITADGWSAYMNQHPQFSGIEFTESTERIDGAATWMQCSIYRHDRIIPTTVREYYSEVKGDHASWNQKPMRMLRYRAMNQCARLAFGIALLEAIPEKNKTETEYGCAIDISKPQKLTKPPEEGLVNSPQTQHTERLRKILLSEKSVVKYSTADLKLGKLSMSSSTTNQ